MQNSKKKRMITTIAVLSALTIVFCICPAFAADEYMGVIEAIVKSMTGVIGNIFKVVGILLGTYAIGSLIMAFKNEDPDSKTKASTLLVVSIVLIAFPNIISSIGLEKFLR